MLARVKFYAFARYYWHVLFMITRTGKAAEFRESGHTPWLLPFLVLRAHASTLVRLPYLLRERYRIFKTRRANSKEFRDLLAMHSISVRKVAEL